MKKPKDFYPPKFALDAQPTNKGWVYRGNLIVPNKGLLSRMRAWDVEQKKLAEQEVAAQSKVDDKKEALERLAKTINTIETPEAKEKPKPKAKRKRSTKKKTTTTKEDSKES